jgi:hypothetical protein
MKKLISAIGAIGATGLIAPMVAMAGPQGQFSDVQPTNWAYQAIMNLRNRYGCAVGFPDGTFRAGAPATRAELAALTNACLDEITTYADARDAAMASALRAEVGAVSNRVTKLEVVAAEKAQGVGNYLGAGVMLNKQGVEGGGYSEDRVIAGGTVQARYAINTFSNENAISIRPYANFVAGPNSQFGAGGGALLSYDFSVAKREGVSAVNIYAGAGYQVPFVNDTQANFQSAVGEKGQVVFALGIEGRLTNSLVGFADLKFPTTNAGDSYGASDASYSPVLTTGLGFKF